LKIRRLPRKETSVELLEMLEKSHTAGKSAMWEILEKPYSLSNHSLEWRYGKAVEKAFVLFSPKTERHGRHCTTNECFRVNNVLKNMPEFADAFFCPPGANMNSSERCSVW
uniref:Peptidase_M13 domain-containing protein n=1 Tax=Heligmosomoides polygyrus TaxID=6339 RepID=A0A183GBE0_HELPZ